MSEVWEDPYYGQGDKLKLLVALALADYANSEGSAWPSIESLAFKSRSSVRGVQETLRELEKDGKISVQVGVGPMKTNRYLLCCTPHAVHPARSAPRKRAAEKAAEIPPEKAAPVCTQTVRNHHEPSGTTMNHHSPSPEAKQEKRPREKKKASEKGLSFADWFNSLLPPDQKHEQNWRENWGRCYDRLISIDLRSPAEIVKVCRWGRADNWWSVNFLSPTKLRQRDKNGVLYFDVLKTRMENTAVTPRTAAAEAVAKDRATTYPQKFRIPVLRATEDGMEESHIEVNNKQ